MEDLYGIQTRRQGVAENIQKALGAGYEPEGTDENTNIQKGRVGVYEDNAENRRLNRVGQQYGKKKEEEQPKGKVSTKKEDEPSDKKGASEKQDMSSHAAKASDGALKRAAEDKNASEEVRNAAKEELKKLLFEFYQILGGVPMLKPGLYEQVINKELSNELDENQQLIEKRNIDKAEAP